MATALNSELSGRIDKWLAQDGAKGARLVAKTLSDAGCQAVFAGGCVRDLLLGRDVHDVDIATSATPGQVEALFPRTYAVGKAFGIIVVLAGDEEFEVATFRDDGAYSDGRHPDSVRFATAQEDAGRRDFTINGMFLDPATGEVIDYVGGLADMDAKVIRAIGDPSARFAEDKLRMLRAVRFAGALGFEIEPRTARAIRDMASELPQVSKERISKELIRTLAESRDAGRSMELYSSLGLMEHIIPEVEQMRGVAQPPQFHPEGDVFTHTRLMLSDMPPPPRDERLGMAVMLHDVGKRPTYEVRNVRGEERITFRRHAEVGAEMAEDILRGLKCPARYAEDVAHIVRAHMGFHDMDQMRGSTVKKKLASPTIDLELELLRLDSLHSVSDQSDYVAAMGALAQFRAENSLPPRFVTGRDLLDLGFREGRALGALLEEAYDRQLDGVDATRAAQLEWLRARLAAGK